MTTAAEFLARGVCGYGHPLFGSADLFRHDSGLVECARCREDMIKERANLRLAAVERRAAGRGR